MGFFDGIFTDTPSQRLQKLKLQEYERAQAEADAVRATGVNYLSGYKSPEEIGATPQAQQRNLLGAAAIRGAETSPDGLNRRTSIGGSVFGYDAVPTPDLMDAAFPQQAMARTEAAAFPAQVDPDKRFKPSADGTLWDVAPAGGGVPKRYGDPKVEMSPLAKLRADYAAGRLSKDEYDAALAHETNVPGTSPLDIETKQANLAKIKAETEAAKIKAAGQKLYADMPDGLAGEDAYSWAENNTPDGKSVAAIARKVASGDIKMPTAGKPGSLGEKVMGLVSRAEPGVDIGQRYKTAQEYSQAGPTGKAILAVDTTLMHTDKMLSAFDNMKNGSFPLWNTIANTGAESVGSGDPGAFTTSRDAVASEARKVFAGASGGGITELTEWKDNLKQNASPEQMQKSAAALQALLAGRLEPLVFQYNQSQGKNKTIRDFISPESRKVWDKLEAVARNGVAIPPPAQRVKGEKYRTPKGLMEWTGTGWLPAGG